MERNKIDKTDYNRVILTEILPYEVPMLFSNEGFYKIISENKYKKYFEIFNKSSSNPGQHNLNLRYGIPFNYEIKKDNSDEVRVLSIIHPKFQYEFIELFKNYDFLLINLCSKSKISLRKIKNIAKSYSFSKSLAGSDELLDKNDESDIKQETKYLKSYFTYEPYNLISEFYNGDKYQRLEQRFNYLMEFDISKCFYNIYTHSICWAVKNKESAKRNIHNESFENKIDTLMQKSNYNETNGIVVGPQISRIFAEIILQKVDINVLKNLKKQPNFNYNYGVDFEIRRYVDDYFIFSNEEKLLDMIKKAFEDELSFYKLYLNQNKIKIITSPFITNETIGKIELKLFLNNFYNTLFDNNNSLKVKNPKITYITFIKNFKCIVKKNNLSYALNKDVIIFFKDKISKILENLKNENNVTQKNILLIILDILFSTYSLNINSNTTFKIAQIIIFVCKFLEKQDNDLKYSVYTKISKEADFALTNFKRKSKSNNATIEILNLILAIKELGPGYSFSVKRLKEIFNLNNLDCYFNLNYFQIVTLLYYINSSVKYNKIRKNLEKAIIKKYKKEMFPFEKSELTLLFFDFISCPFVSKETKKEIIEITKYQLDKNSNKDEIIEKISSEKKWFMDWNLDVDLGKELKKKEWGESY